ncbi:MAG: hypothetical protein R2807_02625 [Chitinophagales bacterium]
MNELKALSPLLANLKEQTPLVQVPASYFEQFQESVMATISEQSGVLSSLKKSNPDVPEGYFSTFSEQIVAKIKQENETIAEGKLVALPRKSNRIISIFKVAVLAASIVGVLVLIKKIQTPILMPAQINIEESMASLTRDEIYQYMNANSNEFGMEQIKKAVLPAIEAQSAITTETPETPVSITENDIDTYLEEHSNIIEIDDSTTDIF